MQHVYKNIDGNNPSRQCNVLIVFDDIVADMISNKTLKLKLNIPLVFIIQSYFAVLKNVRLNSTHYFIMKIQSKQQLQQIAINHSLTLKISWIFTQNVQKIHIFFGG